MKKNAISTTSREILYTVVHSSYEDHGDEKNEQDEENCGNELDFNGEEKTQIVVMHGQDLFAQKNTDIIKRSKSVAETYLYKSKQRFLQRRPGRSSQLSPRANRAISIMQEVAAERTGTF